eukprot:scaffold396778_cov17-Prasinocladus_malaysianus.AAC.2
MLIKKKQVTTIQCRVFIRLGSRQGILAVMVYADSLSSQSAAHKSLVLMIGSSVIARSLLSVIKHSDRHLYAPRSMDDEAYECRYR